MHSLLEQYLSEVAVHLSALPVKRRNEELREMRAHLENAVIVSRELGQTEDKAAQNIVAQFGTPKDLGEDVVWAWRREQTRNICSLWSAAACTTGMLCLLFFVMDQRAFDLLLDKLLPHTFLLFLGKHPGYGRDFTQAIFLTTFGLAGIVASCLFPKRAVRGACLGLALFWIGWAAVDGLGYGGVWRFLSFIFSNGWSLAAVISAWAGSRLRLTWGKNRRLTRV